MEISDINDNYYDVRNFLDLFENKGVYRISIEANQIPSPYRQIRSGLTYRSNSLAGMLREAIVLFKRSPHIYGDDLRQVIRALKTHGVLHESEGLPKKYDECIIKYDKMVQDYEELKKDYDELRQTSEEMLNIKNELEEQTKRLELENQRLKMQVDET